MNGFVENWHLNSEGTWIVLDSAILMLNSFCKQNNHSGVEFAKVMTVCKAEIPWQTHQHFGSGSCQGYPRCMLINMRVVKGFFVTRERPFLFPVNCEVAKFFLVKRDLVTELRTVNHLFFMRIAKCLFTFILKCPYKPWFSFSCKKFYSKRF